MTGAAAGVLPGCYRRLVLLAKERMNRRTKGEAMIHHDSEMRLQFARERADGLAAEMRRSRGLTPDEVGYPGWARLGSALAGRVERLRRRRHVPAYQA
jgi:hypothetical protein